jgi:hypothetical protein
MCIVAQISTDQIEIMNVRKDKSASLHRQPSLGPMFVRFLSLI